MAFQPPHSSSDFSPLEQQRYDLQVGDQYCPFPGEFPVFGGFDPSNSYENSAFQGYFPTSRPATSFAQAGVLPGSSGTDAAAWPQSPSFEQKIAAIEQRGVSNLSEARLWRNRFFHHVPHFPPNDFLAQEGDHIQRLVEAMTNLEDARDGPRRTATGAMIAPSKGWLSISQAKFQREDFQAGAWLVWDALLTLHTEGTYLDLNKLPHGVCKAARETDYDLEVSERFERVVKLYRESKLAVSELLKGYEIDAMKHVRAPSGFLKCKAEYRRTNDGRGRPSEDAAPGSQAQSSTESSAPARKRRRTSKAGPSA